MRHFSFRGIAMNAILGCILVEVQEVLVVKQDVQCITDSTGEPFVFSENVNGEVLEAVFDIPNTLTHISAK